MDKILRYTGKDLQDIDMETWLKNKPLELQPITEKWFSIIKNCGDDVQDIFHDGYPIGCVESAPFAYVNAFSSHINVGFFYGAELNDPSGILEGKGKRMRHIKIRPVEKINDEAILLLLKLAYSDIKKRLADLS